MEEEADHVCECTCIFSGIRNSCRIVVFKTLVVIGSGLKDVFILKISCCLLHLDTREFDLVSANLVNEISSTVIIGSHKLQIRNFTFIDSSNSCKEVFDCSEHFERVGV